MVILREVPYEDRATAAARVRKWGYPRSVAWAEIENGIWVRTEDGTAFAWFIRGPIERGHWMLHAQLKPAECEGLRPRYPSGEMLAALLTVAGLAGATRVYVALGDTRPGWRRFLRRSGYFQGEDHVGPYMILE